jgi:hypothetical protein
LNASRSGRGSAVFPSVLIVMFETCLSQGELLRLTEAMS